jgi:capsular exopolysaccharide synthesis family protein
MDDNFLSESSRQQPRLEMAAQGPGTSPRRMDASSGTSDGEVHLLDYVRVLYKRRRTALTAFLLVVLTVTVYTFTATPIYEARTRLLIEADNPNVVSFAEVINEEQAKADYYQTQYNILQSRALARRTLQTLELWDRAPFGAGEPGGAAGFTAEFLGVVKGVATEVVRVLGAAGPDDAVADDEDGDHRAADETMAQSKAIDVFLDGLTVTPIRNSRLVDVRVRLADPVLATRIANSVAKGYIEQNLEYKFLASKEASDWLGERLAEQRKLVEVAEVKLQQYREQNDAISLEDRENIVVQKLTDLNAAVTQAKTERFQKEAVYTQLQALRGKPEALDTFPAILTNSFIQQQKAEMAKLQSEYAQAAEKLGPNHPDMVKIRSAMEVTGTRVDVEIAKVVEGVRNDFEAALAKERSLTGALEAQKSDAMAMNRKAIDYNVLERDVQSTRQIYESLMQRAKETGVSTELKTSNIRVVDQAERPQSPVAPKKALNLMLALFGGTFFAFGLTFFFEYLDNRIKTPDEIRTHLGLPYLGMLPRLDGKTVSEVYPLVSNGVPPAFSEGFRGIRTNVLFSSASEGCRSIVVTSTGPGEGKSMVAANLAISLAQAGQRVLLIDADMRKPKVHEVFSITQEPGLSNVLVGNAKASESVRKSRVAGLWLLPAGRIPPNPAELVGSVRFKEFLQSLHDHFDWVVVDSPPIMAVTDAALIAHHASGVLFVVGAEMTSRHAASRALDQLEQAQARFLGAVLNRVDLERNSYYYSQYYRREYAQYYAKTS